MNVKLYGLLLSLLLKILPMVSKELQEALRGFVKNLEERAARTENPFDDLAVRLLKAVLGYDD